MSAAKDNAEEQATYVGRLLRTSISGDVTAVEHERGRLRLREALRQAEIEQLKPRSLWPRSLWPRVALGGVGLAACVALGFFFLGGGFGREEQLQYAVISAEGASSSTLEAPADAPLDTEFDDGSRLHLAPATRVRIEKDGERSGRVVLERGTVELSVVAGSREVTRLHAGPFRIDAAGAELTATWSNVDERAVVAVTRGRALVASEGSGSTTVRAGQRFSADVRRGTHAVEDAARVSEATRADDRFARALRGAGKSEVGSVEASPPGGKSTDSSLPVQGLSGLVASGDFEGVISAAKSLGIDRCLSGCSTQDLRALADAARYTGKRDLAERSLHALERRPGSSTVAAFLLGRHYEATSPAQALEWYATYSKRSPRGTYAAEAMAGKMRALESLGRRREAEQVARSYLSAFPEGVHAVRARRLLGER